MTVGQSRIHELKDFFSQGRTLTAESEKKLDNFCKEFQKIYGFSVIENPAENYRLFVRMWRSGLVIKENNEIKSTNLMYFQNADLFFDIQNGADERKAVFDGTKYDSKLNSATILNDSIPNILVSSIQKRSLQDYDAGAFNINVDEIIRSVNLLANSLLTQDEMLDRFFMPGVISDNIMSDRMFTPESINFLSEVISNEINIWKSYIQNLSHSQYIDNEVLKIMDNARIPDTSIYNWLIASDIKNNEERLRIKENRMDFAKNWPMAITSIFDIQNPFDKYFIAVKNGTDIAPLLAEELNIPVNIVEKLRGVSPKDIGKNMSMSFNGFSDILYSISDSNVKNVPSSPKEWNIFSLQQEWIKQCNKLIESEEFKYPIPLTLSPNINMDKFKKAIEVLPMVAYDLGDYLMGIPAAYAYHIHGKNKFNPFSISENGLLHIFNNRNLDEIIDYVVEYFPKINSLHNQFNNSLRLPKSKEATMDCLWKSFLNKKSMILPSRYKILAVDSMSEVYDIENIGNIPFIPLAFMAYFDVDKQYIAIQDSVGKYIAAAQIDLKELNRIVSMDENGFNQRKNESFFSEMPSYINYIVTPDGMEPNSEILGLLWEMDTEFVSNGLHDIVDYNILMTEKKLRVQRMSEHNVPDIPWKMVKSKLWENAYDVLINNSLVVNTDTQIYRDDPMKSFESIAEESKKINSNPTPEPVYEREESKPTTPPRSKPRFIPRTL